MNDLFALFYGPDRQHGQIMDIFDQAFNYAKFHFATEEKYFHQFNYEYAEEHISMHREFGEKIGDLRKKFELDQVDPTVNLMDFFEDWLVNHLNFADKKYMKCFHDNGLV